jgi:RNA polymerase sigma factor (sigma-70 family)
VQTVALGRVPECDRFVSRVDGPEELALWRAGSDEMQAWLAALPTSYRAVLVLRYYQELSYAEIAETLDEPVSTVRMRLFRARNQLSKIVTEAEQERATPLLTLLLA